MNNEQLNLECLKIIIQLGEKDLKKALKKAKKLTTKVSCLQSSK